MHKTRKGISSNSILPTFHNRHLEGFLIIFKYLKQYTALHHIRAYMLNVFSEDPTFTSKIYLDRAEEDGSVSGTHP